MAENDHKIFEIAKIVGYRSQTVFGKRFNTIFSKHGNFASILLDGSLKLVRVSGNGPWETNTDPLDVFLEGPTNIGVSVRPYFTMIDADFSVTGDVLSASCRLTNVIAGSQIEHVPLGLGKTTILDGPTKLFTVLPLPAKAYIYARIPLKVVGLPEWLYPDVYTVIK